MQKLTSILFSLMSLVLLSKANDVITAPLKTRPRNPEELNSLDQGTITLYNNYDSISYNTMVSFGSNNQPLSLAISTGSGVTWVPNPQQTQFKQNFNCQTSATCIETSIPYTISDFGINLEGFIAYDTLDIGPFQLTNFSFVIVENSQNFNPVNSSGTLGLGPSNSSDFSNLLVHKMKQEGLIQNASFGLYLSKSKVSDAGEIMFGGYDSRYIVGPLQALPVNQSFPTWGVNMKSMSFGNKVFSDEFLYSVIDTATTFMAFPTRVMKRIEAQLNETRHCYYHFGLLTCSCNNINDFEDLIINFGTVSVTIPVESYWFYKGDACMMKVSDWPAVEHAILGISFIQNTYVYFDYDNQQISLSPYNISKEKREIKA